MLPHYRSLKSLHLALGTAKSLVGIENFVQLERCNLFHCYGLREIATVAALSHLAFLHIDHCRNITDIDALKACRALRTLRLNSCGDIPSISFVGEMPDLEEFRFVKTNVLDGDMSPCLSLKECAFSNKRHFSHSLKQVEKAIRDR
jgi:hypothetical protein